MKKLFLVLLAVLLSGGALLYVLYTPYDTKSPMNISFEVPKGASTARVASDLAEQKLIRSRHVFLLMIKQAGQENNLKAGRYVLSQDMSYADLIETLVKGSSYVEAVRTTIPEGYELRQIASLLSEKGLADEAAFLSALDPGLYGHAFLEEVDTSDLEGFLFPDTYDIPVGYPPEKIVSLFLDRFDEVFTETYEERLEELDMSLKDLVTLASIVEREARHAPERKTIAGVFYNRLESGMLLQSCATVQYALGERKDVLTYEDTAIESPYNTYLHKGLPPAPIASPGKESIEAALFPETHPYKFFFAIPGDPDGRHVFSITYAEHLAAQARYKD